VVWLASPGICASRRRRLRESSLCRLAGDKWKLPNCKTYQDSVVKTRRALARPAGRGSCPVPHGTQHTWNSDRVKRNDDRFRRHIGGTPPWAMAGIVYDARSTRSPSKICETVRDLDFVCVRI
jgi:hypothetical protein